MSREVIPMAKAYIEYSVFNNIKNKFTKRCNQGAFSTLNIQIGKLIGRIETLFKCDVKYRTDKYNNFWIEFHPSNDYIIEIDIDANPANLEHSKIEVDMHVQLFYVRHDAEYDKNVYKSILIEDFIIVNDGIIPTKDDRHIIDAYLYDAAIDDGVLSKLNNLLFSIARGVTK
jgi:hypothetical protein